MKAGNGPLDFANAKKYELLSLDHLSDTSARIISQIGENLLLDEQAVFNIKLVLSELVINGFTHGQAGNCGRSVKIDVCIDEHARSVGLMVDDGGQGFSQNTLHDQAPLSDEHGRGLILVHAISEQVIFNDCGNQVSVHISV